MTDDVWAQDRSNGTIYAFRAFLFFGQELYHVGGWASRIPKGQNKLGPRRSLLRANRSLRSSHVHVQPLIMTACNNQQHCDDMPAHDEKDEMAD